MQFKPGDLVRMNQQRYDFVGTRHDTIEEGSLGMVLTIDPGDGISNIGANYQVLIQGKVRLIWDGFLDLIKSV